MAPVSVDAVARAVVAGALGQKSGVIDGNNAITAATTRPLCPSKSTDWCDESELGEPKMYAKPTAMEMSTQGLRKGSESSMNALSCRS